MASDLRKTMFFCLMFIHIMIHNFINCCSWSSSPSWSWSPLSLSTSAPSSSNVTYLKGAKIACVHFDQFCQLQLVTLLPHWAQVPSSWTTSLLSRKSSSESSLMMFSDHLTLSWTWCLVISAPLNTLSARAVKSTSGKTLFYRSSSTTIDEWTCNCLSSILKVDLFTTSQVKFSPSCPFSKSSIKIQFQSKAP